MSRQNGHKSPAIWLSVDLQDGLLVRGRGDLWETIDAEPLVNVMVRSLAWFHNALWIGGEKGLFRYDGRGIAPVEIGAARASVDEESGAKEELTYGQLVASERRLWSIGSDYVYWTEDGQVWTRVLMPLP